MTASWRFGTARTGYIVEIIVGNLRRGYFYAWHGGRWGLRSDGSVGSQELGTGDIRAPRSMERFKAWARRQHAEEVRDMKSDAEHGDPPCALSMGCLCYHHATGGASYEACDAVEPIVR